VTSNAHRRLDRGGPGWPEQLEHLRQPPAGLWVLGSVAPLWPAVAVVGSRHPTLTGVDIARSLGRDLAAAGVQVISGFARGIDAAAHDGALEGGGTTVAVLGCGLDVDYPRGHLRLREAVIASGALITEDGPGAPPEAWRFPRRNRLIAALSAAVIVVEATERSGALSTARWAADLGRDVLAVPGSIRSDRSRGTNLLIRDGARPLLDVADVFEAVPELAHLRRPRGPQAGRRSSPDSQLELPLRELLDQLGPDPVHPDDLGASLGLSAAALASRLTVLEMGGAIRTLAGGLVARTISDM